MQVICKTTAEVSDKEIGQVAELFQEVFGKQRDSATFREEYILTPLGYSYHAILKDDEDHIVGFHTCMPFYYMNEDRRFIAALGIDSMVKRKYRDYFNFHDMVIACQERLRKDGCTLRIGFPNDNSYPVLKKGLRHKEIGRLTTYCMIRNIGSVEPSLAWLNPLSRIAAGCQYLLSYLSIGHKFYRFRYRKERSSFDAVRYRWFGSDYHIVQLGGVESVYKIFKHEGVDTAFLLDVHPLSRSAFESAVRHIYRHEKNRIDMILYVGKLPFSPVGLIPVPRRFEPKHFHFTCLPLDKQFDDSLYDIHNWEVNLSNFDLL